MKKLGAIVAAIFFLNANQSSSAQTTIIDPHGDGGFELGSTFSANGWNLVNNASGVGNNWRFTSETLTSSVNSFTPTGDNAVFITRYATGNTWEYKITEYSTTHFYKDVTFPIGEEIINLDFRWNAKGEGTSTGTYDVLYVYLCPTTLTPVLGSPFNTSSVPSAWVGSGTATLLGAFHSSSIASGQVANLTLPASLAGSTQRLVFTWKNGNILGVQPPVALDSISLTSDCPKSNIFINSTTVDCSGIISLNSIVTDPVSTGSYQWFINDDLIVGATTANFTSAAVITGDEISVVYYSNNACEYNDTAFYTVYNSSNAYRTEDLVLCSGQLPYYWRGFVPILPGTIGHFENYITIAVPKTDGCDSIITLNVTINEQAAPRTEYISTCRNLLSETYWRGKLIPADAISNPKFDSVIVKDPNGCDSLIYLNLQIIDSTTSSYESIVGCDEVIYNGINYKNSIRLVDTFRNAVNCDSFYQIVDIIIDSFNIEFVPLENEDLAEGSYIELHTRSNDPTANILSWMPYELFDNQHAHSNLFKVPLSETIIVTAINSNGCTDTAQYAINAIPYDEGYIIPSAFSPNGDGLNDVFRPLFTMKRNFHSVDMDIYDRWGNRIYAGTGNSGTVSWDGTHNGQYVNTGVYYYQISINFSAGERKIIKGDITVVR